MIDVEYQGEIYKVKMFAEMTPGERAEIEEKIARIKRRGAEIDDEIAAFRLQVEQALVARLKRMS